MKSVKGYFLSDNNRIARHFNIESPKLGKTQINGQDFDVLEVYPEAFKGLANNYLGYNGSGMHFPTNQMEIAVQEIKVVINGIIQKKINKK